MSFELQFLNNLKIAAKFRLIVLGFTIPSIFLLILILSSNDILLPWKIFIITMTTILFFVMITLTSRISGSFLTDVKKINGALSKASLRDFNIESGIFRGDELGELGRNFNVMISELEKFLSERNERLFKAESALSREIADHIHSEEERTKQELLFSEVLNISVDGMRLTDEEGKIILVNDAYSRVVEMPRESLEGHLFSEVYHPDQRESVLELYKRDILNNSIKTHFEREDMLWNEKKIWFEFSNSFLKVSDSVLVLSVIRDISERKNAEFELMRRTQQLRNLASRLQSIREEERTMIAREIHDELGQVLTVLKIQVSLLANKLREDQKTLKSKIESVLKVIDLSVESVQKISAKLRPGILDDLGLVAAIEWQAQDFQEMTGIECICNLPKEDIELNETKSTAIFRIFQEAITNVARHSQAGRTEIDFVLDSNNLILEVRDNGKGISGKEIGGSKSLGILGMKERALILGGEVFITGTPGKGTKVKVVMPVNHS